MKMVKNKIEKGDLFLLFCEMLVMVMQPTEAEYLVERMKRYYLSGVTIYIVKNF